MRKLALLAACVAVLLLGLPPVLGGLTESAVRERVAALDANIMLTAAVTRYERGWLSSEATIELGIDELYAEQVAAGGPGALPGPLPGAAPIAIDVAHGPIAVGNGNGVHFGSASFVARLDAQAEEVRALLATLGVPYLFEFRGRTSFGGTVRFDADMPAMEVDDPGFELTFSGATLDGALDGRALEWNLDAQSLRIRDENGNFLLQGLEGGGEIEFLSRYLALGSGQLELTGVQAMSPWGEPLFEASGISMQGAYELDDSGELVTGTITYALDSLTAAEANVSVSEAIFGMRVGNLDVAALEAYYRGLEGALAASAMQTGEDLLAELQPALQQALTRSPNLAIEPIRVRLDGEPLDARIFVEIDSAALPPGGLDPVNPFALIGALRATAGATLSKTLAQNFAMQIVSAQLAMMSDMPPDQAEYMAGAQAGLMLVTLVGQGYLQDDGETYSTELQFANGALTINGNALPLPIP